MLIELSFFPEQVATGRSPYEQLKTLHEESIERFKAQYESSEDTDTAQGEIGAYGFPSYGFPEDLGGLVGWGTKF